MAMPFHLSLQMQSPTRPLRREAPARRPIPATVELIRPAFAIS
jgi:hypothetical protein